MASFISADFSLAASRSVYRRWISSFYSLFSSWSSLYSLNKSLQFLFSAANVCSSSSQLASRYYACYLRAYSTLV